MKNPKWNWRPLGELFDISAGKTMSAAARAGANKVPFLRTSNVFWDEIDLTEVDQMSISPAEMVEKSLKTGDLLVCEGGEIGRAAVWDGRVPIMSFQNHLHRLRPTQDDVDAQFYVYFLQSAFTQLGIFEGAGNKTTIPNLSRNRLAALDVPHPPKPEQQSVSQTLAKVRDAISVHDKAMSTALELKHSVMRDLFTRGLRGEPQKDTEIGPTPESWVLESIGAHFSVVSGGTPSRGNPAYWTGGSIPWVKTTEVDYCEITETEEYITPEGLENSAAKLLPKGTLLMAMYGQGVTRGKVAILGIKAACNQACAAMSPIDDVVRAQYLYHFLTWRYEEIRSLAHGGQQQNLNLEIVRCLQVAIPPTHVEQDEIVTILDSVDRKIDLHQKKREVLEELFESLLHKLMTGEIAASDLDLSALLPASTQPEEATA